MVSLPGATWNRQPAMMHCETASTSLRGDRRENQDRCAVLEGGTSILLLLADGMGGHARGELAAATFDLTDLEKGVYILNFQVGDQRVVRKVVRE